MERADPKRGPGRHSKWCPSGNSGWTQCSFRAGNEEFFVLERKSRACAEAYIGTPHKQVRRLTPPGRKRTDSGRKLNGRKGRKGPDNPGIVRTDIVPTMRQVRFEGQ